MPYFYPVIGWIVVVFCQIVIVPRLEVSQVYPDVILIVVALLGLKRGWKSGLWFGFAMGITIGLLDPLNHGWIMVLVSMTGFFAGIIKEKIYVESDFYRAGVLLVLIFLYQFLFRLISWPQYSLDNMLDSLSDSFLISAYSTLVGAIGLWLIGQRHRIRELL
jgi:rod shape-determining protein MreD